MTYVQLWLRAFLLTTLTELPIAVPLLRVAEPSLARRAATVVLVNLASHPVVWFVIARTIASRATMTFVAETWAVVSEALIYALVVRGLSPARAVATSAFANAASFALGAVLNRFS